MAYFKINNKPRAAQVALTRATHVMTPDVALWVAIRHSCNQLDFRTYKAFVDDVMTAGSIRSSDITTPSSDTVDPAGNARVLDEYKTATGGSSLRIEGDRDPTFTLLPFTGSDRYALLKAATEVFVMAKCGVDLRVEDFANIVAEVSADFELSGNGIDFAQITPSLWAAYLEHIAVPPGENGNILPYYGLILDKLKDAPVDLGPRDRELTTAAYRILRQKLVSPCFLELIWSYWHEEGMLMQAINAILLRFQNIRSSDRDPLANMEIDPLRPLNNLLWGLIQDEQNRLTVQRRAYEYNHQYGIGLVGKAVPTMRAADTRSKFIEAFHNLIYLASVFYKEDDDTTVIADGFPLLNALKEVHIILTEGSHNQYGDLPSMARQEMLMQQWILARPEMREFLPTRVMVAYSEPWMDRVDAMKKIQGWTETSVYHFRDLGVFGEQILLAIRFGAWSKAFNAEQGANWARFWRSEVQGYLHAYRAVTGVDLTADPTMPEQAQLRTLPPSAHLQRRLAQQMQKLLPVQSVRMPSLSTQPPRALMPSRTGGNDGKS
ncbi:MAG TPA: hypothetical protein VLM79_16260 [Kofleriaceae bacterium]|nr:hypothetical protein [Kofleriaceae bacterium]